MRITKPSVVGLHAPFAASHVGAHALVAQGLLATGSGASQQAGASLSYDQDLRPSDLRYTNTPSGGSAATAAEVQPTYDAAGNVQTLTTTLAAVGTAAGGTETQAFCYDWAERLIWAGTSGTGPCGKTGSEGISGAGYTASYSYDTLGRITSASVLNGSGGSLPGAAQGSYTYDPTHVHGVASVGSGATGYAASYDAAGNMTCRAVGATSCGSSNEQLTDDPLGRLLTWQNAATAPTASEQYAYDGSGQRVWQQASSTSGSTTTTTSLTYVLGVEEVSSTSVTGQQPTTSTLSYYHLAGGLSASRDSSGLVVQMSDLLGTPIAALNLSTGLVGEQLRTPYGQARYAAAASSGGGMHTTFGFTGQREDTQAPGSSGLYYFNARYYDPTVGRFTSADPTRPDLGSPWGTDAYGYVGGMVEQATDPSGLIMDPEVHTGGGDYGPVVVAVGGALVVSAVDRAIVSNPGGFQDAMAQVTQGTMALLNTLISHITVTTTTTSGTRTQGSTYTGTQAIDVASDLVENQAGYRNGYRNIPTKVPVTQSTPTPIQTPIPTPGGTTSSGGTTSGPSGPASVGFPAAPPSLGADAWSTLISTLAGVWYAASSGIVIAVDKQGHAVPVPAGWNARDAKNGKGVIFQQPGAQGDTNSVRIADPTPQYPRGYLRYYNAEGGGQPLDAGGKPTSKALTHIPLDSTDPVPGYYQWLEGFIR